MGHIPQLAAVLERFQSLPEEDLGHLVHFGGSTRGTTGRGRAPPRLDAVIGTNRCQLHLASNGTEVVVQSVIDNLVKGASGGAIHWLNRLFGLPQTAGLDAAPLPWS